MNSSKKKNVNFRLSSILALAIGTVCISDFMFDHSSSECAITRILNLFDTNDYHTIPLGSKHQFDRISDELSQFSDDYNVTYYKVPKLKGKDLVDAKYNVVNLLGDTCNMSPNFVTYSIDQNGTINYSYHDGDRCYYNDNNELVHDYMKEDIYQTHGVIVIEDNNDSPKTLVISK